MNLIPILLHDIMEDSDKHCENKHVCWSLKAEKKSKEHANF